MEFKLNEKEEQLLKEFEAKHSHIDIAEGPIPRHIEVIFNCTSQGEFPSVRCIICGREESTWDFEGFKQKIS